MADETHRLTAPEAAGRLDAWLASALPLSRSQLAQLVRDGAVTVDGAVVRPRRRLRGGEQVVVVVPAPPSSELVAQDLGVPVLHLDEHVVVVDKPAGLVVHPGKGHADGTLVNALLHLLRPDLPQDPGPPRPGIVHRLDAGTSGVMMVARTPEAHASLSAQLAARTVDRRYVALAWGRAPASGGTVDQPLGRHPRDRKRFAVVEGGKRAVTHWQVLARSEGGSDRRPAPVCLVACKLETGRTHQIRVHLHHLGLPLLGDPVYGRRGALPPALAPALAGVDHQLLHAQRLGFTHPLTGLRLHFSTPVPPDFSSALAQLGLPAPEGLPDPFEDL